MLNEAKDVLTSNPTQMIAPGIAIVVLVCCFNPVSYTHLDVYKRQILWLAYAN